MELDVGTTSGAELEAGLSATEAVSPRSDATADPRLFTGSRIGAFDVLVAAAAAVIVAGASVAAGAE
jgi:hypothetical protein